MDALLLTEEKNLFQNNISIKTLKPSPANVTLKLAFVVTGIDVNIFMKIKPKKRKRHVSYFI
jgi:hypothetical protein